MYVVIRHRSPEPNSSVTATSVDGAILMLTNLLLSSHVGAAFWDRILRLAKGGKVDNPTVLKSGCRGVGGLPAAMLLPDNLCSLALDSLLANAHQSQMQTLARGLFPSEQKCSGSPRPKKP